MKYLIYIMLIFTFSSCVSLKPAKDINKAENKIKKFNKGLQNQVDRFPSLASLAYTFTVYDTVKVPGDTINFKLPLQDSSIIADLEASYLTSSKQIDSIILLNENLDHSKLNTKQLRNNFLLNNRLLKNYKAKSDSLFILYRSAVALNNRFGTKETDKFLIDYKLVNGILDIKVKTKDKFVVVEKEIKNYDIKIKGKFYQDWRFWVLISIIIALIYFIGDKITDIVQSLINSIIGFIKKLILKI